MFTYVLLSIKNQHMHGAMQHVDQRGYVVSLEYTGQLVAGLRAIISLQCWIASFRLPMVLVEPYVVQSRLMHGVHLWKTEFGTAQTPPLTISDFFNMDYFLGDRSPFVSTKELWGKAPRKVILMSVAGSNRNLGNCLQYTKKAMCLRKNASPIQQQDTVDYATSGCEPTGNSLKEATAFLEKQGFIVVRSVCINCDRRPSMVFTPTELSEYIFGSFKASEVTLVVNRWKFSHELSPHCVSCKHQSINDENTLMQFTPSRQLMKHADDYIMQLKSTNPKTRIIAVMIRMEWFLIAHKRSEQLLQEFRNCLSAVAQTYRQLNVADSKTVLALDIGKYGSGTFAQTIRINNITVDVLSQVVESVKQFVTQVNWNYDEWEDSFERLDSRWRNDRGYIALLQSVIVSKADHVIRMGGGHYQQLALDMFAKNHGSTGGDLIKEVCMRRNYVHI